MQRRAPIVVTLALASLAWSGVTASVMAAPATRLDADGIKASKLRLTTALPDEARRLMAVQGSLDIAANAIRTRYLSWPGYTGVSVVPEAAVLNLYWHGSVPPEVATALASVRHQGLIARVIQARHSRQELEVVRNQLVHRPTITTVAVPEDGSGIDVGTFGRSVAASALPEAIASIPIRQHTSRPLLASRWEDTIPFWGGAVYEGTNADGSFMCSTGFGVHQSSHYFILSADHCSERTTPYTIPYSGLVLGIPYSSFSTSDIFSIDTSYMRSSSGVSSGNRIYAQGVDQSGGGANEINRVVRGVNSPVVGDLDCTSGGFSGERCNIKVVNINVTINAGGNIFQRMIQAEQTNHTNAAGNGDSGGPFYKRNSDGTVLATGIISAIDGSVAVKCTGVPTGPGRTCSWRMFAGQVALALSNLNMSINTGPAP